MDHRTTFQDQILDSQGQVVAQQNKVLRNTFALLAVSLIPTVLGAWFGVASGFVMRGWLGVGLFFIGAMAFQVLVYRYRNSAVGVYALLGFTGFMGWAISNLIAHVLRFSNGAELLMLALAGTSAVMFGMTVLAGTIKRDLSGMRGYLFTGMWVLLAAGIIAMIFSMPALHLAYLVGVLGLFSFMLLFDVQRIMRGGETNYVMATMSVYLDLINIFTSLLQLLSIFSGRRE